MMRVTIGLLGMLAPLAAAAAPAAAFSSPPGVDFAPRASYRTGANPRAVAIGDVHRLGKLDIVVANADSGTVSVLFGRGDGTFLTRTDYAAVDPGVESLTALAITDICLSGKPSIVFTTTGSAGVLRNRGGGTFLPPLLYSDFGSPSLALADINRDGKIDLVTSAAEYGVVLQLGDGHGGLSMLPPAGVGRFTYGAAVADLRRNGQTDVLVVSGPDPTAVRTLLGRGNGTFTPGGSVKLPESDYGQNAAPVVADFNFDDRTDMAVLSPTTNTVLVALGRGDGTFLPAKSFPTGANPVALAVADVNRDGKPDIVVVDHDSDTVSVLLGNGDGTFQPRKSFPVGHGPTAVAVADVAASGYPSVVVTNSGDNTLSVLLGRAP